MKKLTTFLMTLALLLMSSGIKAQTIYLSEDFEDFTTSSGGVSSDWNITDNDPSSISASYKWKGSASGYSGKCAYSYMYGTSALKARMKSKSFTLDANEDAKITFMIKGSATTSNCGVLNIYASTDGGTTYSNNLVANITTTADWEYKQFSLAAYKGQTVTLVFEAVGSGTSTTRYIYLDDLLVRNIPTCYSPKDAYVSALGQTTATLMWGLDTVGNYPDNYRVTLRNGSTVVSTDTCNGYVTTFSYTGLTANTTYTVTIQSQCDVRSFHGKSDSVSIQFTTLAQAINPPLYQDFDSLTALPSGYYFKNADLNSSAGYAYGNSGKSLKLTTTAADGAYIIMPLLNLAANNMEMDFYIRRASASSTPVKFKAGYTTNPSDNSAFIPVLQDSLGNDAIWHNFRFNTGSVQDQTNTIMPAIMIEEGTAASLYVDNIYVHTIPTCTRPEGLTATSYTSTDATLDWSMANASNFSVTALNLTDSTTSYYAASQHPYTVTGLEPHTTYEFQVRGICSPTDSSDLSTKVTVKMRCAVAASTTFIETFDSVAANSTPDCWEMGWIKYVTGTGSKSYPFTVNSTTKHGTSGKSMQLQNQPAGTISYLCSQALNFDSTGKYSLRYWYYRVSGTTKPTEGIRIYVTPTIGDTTKAVEVIPFVSRFAGVAPVGNAGSWNEYEGVINYQGIGYIMVVGYSQYSAASYFDDLQVFETPNCQKVTDLVIDNVGKHSVDVSWNAGGTETQWTVAYTVMEGTTSVIDTTVTVSVQPEMTISGLSASTSYSVSVTVTAICSATASAEAVTASASIKTQCEALTSLPYTMGFEDDETSVYYNTYRHPNCWTHYNSATNTSYNYYPYAHTSMHHTGAKALYNYTYKSSTYYGDTITFALPEVDTTAFSISSLRLRFWSAMQTASYSAPVYIGVMTDPNNPRTFVKVDSVIVTGNTFVKNIRNLSSYAGNGSYIAFAWYKNAPSASNNVNCYIDDVTLEPIPSCIDLESGVTVTEVNDHSAKLTLTDTTASSGWSYAYGPAGTDPENMTSYDTTGTVVVLNNLTSKTSYDFYVRRKCGEGQYSPWFEVTNFLTTAVPATIPYVCDFENATENAEWIFVAGLNANNQFAIGTATSAVHSGSFAIYVSNDGGTTHNYTLNKATRTFAYRTIHFDAKGYQIGYKWKCTGGQVSGTTKNDYGRVYLLPTSVAIPSGQTFTNITTANAGGFPAEAIFLDPEGKQCIEKTTTPEWNTVSQYVDMTLTPGDYNLVLVWNNNASLGAQAPLAVDSITIDELSCIPPSLISASALASDSATLIFPQTGETRWQVVVDDEPFTKETVPSVPLFFKDTTASTVTVTGLTQNTEYYMSVRTLCSATDTSEWLEPATFRTLCSAFSTPHTEGFEAVGSDECWTMLPGQTTGSISRVTTQHHSGSASLMSVKSSVVSPEYNVDSLTHYMIDGWAYSATDSITFSVGVMVDPNDETSFTPINDVLIPAKNTWTPFTAYFTLLSSDPQYAEFKTAKHIVLQLLGDQTIYFDDLTVDLTPTCPKPTETEIDSITAHSFRISFTNNSTANQFVVTTNGTKHIVNTNPATITGLDAATSYEVKIAAVCSATDTSDFATVGTIRTECDIISLPWSTGFEASEGYVGGTSYNAETTANFAANCWDVLNNKPGGSTYPYAYVSTSSTYTHTGSQGLYTYTYSSATKDKMYLILPEFAEPSNALRIKLWYKNYGTSTTYSQLMVGYMTDATADSTFTAISTLNRTTSWTEAEVATNGSVTVPANARIALCIDRAGTYGNGLYIDDIEVTQIRSCSDPETPVVSDITASTALVTFADTCATHNAWQYVYGVKGFNPNTATPVAVDTTRTFTLTDLTDDTEYDVYVRAVCGVGDESNFIKASFRTLCVPFHVTSTHTFSDDFNSYNYGAYLNTGTCFDILDEPTSTSYWAKTYPTSVSTSTTYKYCYGHAADNTDRCLYWYLYKSQMPDGGSIVRQFHLDADSTYEFAGWVRNGTSTSYSMKVSMLKGTSTDVLDTLTSKIIDGATVSSVPVDGVNWYYYNTLYQQMKAVFTVDSTGDYYLGFNAGFNPANTYSYNYLYLDDWTVRAFAGCKIAVATVDSTTQNSAFCHHNDTTAGYAYEYYVMSGNDTVVGVTSGNTQNFTVSGLPCSSTLTLYIRHICDDGYYSEWSSLDFNTACGPINNYPYTEGFENSFPPVCWSQFSYGSPANTWASTRTVSYVHSGNKAASIPDKTAGAKTALVTGEFNLTNPYGYYVRFNIYRAAASSYADKNDEALHVGYHTQAITAANIADATELGIVNRNSSLSPVETADAGYYQYEYEVPAGVTGAVWFYFDFHNQYGGGIYLDDITIEPMPSCVAPKNAPTVAATTMTTATVTVDMHGKPEAQITYALGATPNDTIGSVTTTNGIAVIPNLTGSTTYSFRYRYLCGANDTSAWSPAGVGTTTASDFFEPQNLHVVGTVTDSVATVAWGVSPSATAYEYELYQGTSAAGTRVDSARTNGDSLTYTNLNSNTNYFLRVRSIGSDTVSAWTSVSFQTMYKVFDVPFVCDFENSTMNANWNFRHLSSSGSNDLIVGTATKKSGNKSMYVSDDNSSYNYSATTTNVADAELLLNLTAGNYYVTYDWNCEGYKVSTTPYAYGRVFLVPQSTNVAATSYSTYNKSLPAGAISLDGNAALQLNTNWPEYADAFTVPSDGIYKLVVFWANYSTVHTPPLAIDNINIQPLTCMPVDSLMMVGVNTENATARVVPHDSAAVQYGLATADNVDSVSTWTTISGNNISLTGLTPGEDYYLFARHACSATDYSPARKVTFTTPTFAVSLPYITSFEATDSTLTNWTLTTVATNRFVIGNGTSNGGSRALYISNNQSSYDYDITAASWSYAYIPVEFGTGSYELSYDWMGYGESTYDYARVFLAPYSMVPQADVQLTGLTYSALPDGCIAMDGGTKLNLNSDWSEKAAEFVVNASNTYNLIVAWRNDASTGTTPPFAMDNLVIKPLTCPRLQFDSLVLDSSSTNMFRIKMKGDHTGKSMIYHVASTSSFRDTVAAGVTSVGDSLITVSGLEASTWYWVRLWSLCGAGDTSSAMTCRIRTVCGVRGSYPYDEDFENYTASSSEKTQLTQNCWIVDAHAGGSTAPYHYMTTSSTYVHGGSKALYIYNSSYAGSYQTFGMPKVDSLAGKRLSMWYKNYNSTSTGLATLEVGYMSNPSDATSFVSLTTAPFNTNYSEFVYTYPATVPAGARPAFKANGIYYMYVDDIHLNNIVNGEEYYETICYQGAYTEHGFNAPATTLLPGDTTLTRIAVSSRLGVADSLIQAHIHVLPDLNTATKDTICAGEDYNRGMWNLTAPTTDMYQRTFTSSLGCDSTVYLHLFVYDSTKTLRDTICQGDVYTFGGQQLTQTGTYVDTITNPHGCDIVTTLYLLVVDSADIDTAVICQGDYYEFEGTRYTQAGVYRVQKTGIHNCPLVRTLVLGVRATALTIDTSFCKGGQVTLLDTTIDDAGTYIITRLSSEGCNVTYTLNVTEDAIIEGYVSDNACQGYPYSGYGVQGVTITQDTVILVNTKTIDGQCDSVGHVSLTFVPTSYGDTSVTIKQGESYTWHEQTYNTAGDYTDTIYSSLGCDSICTLHLYVSGSAVENVNEVIVNIVPNPVHAGETAYVTGDFTSDVTTVEILNSYGQVVDRFVPQTYPIEVQGINAAGLYYVRITTSAGQVHLQKLIVK